MILPSVQTPSTSETMMRMSRADATVARMLSDDRRQQRVVVLGRGKEVIRVLGQQRLRRGFPRSDSDGCGRVGNAAADVVNRVADDDHVAPFEAMPVEA